MGGRAKAAERQQARDLRARGWTLAAIATAVGASKGTVSTWVRDVAFDTPPPRTRAAPRHRSPNALERRKADAIAAAAAEGRARVGTLSDRELLLVGTALYAAEGTKRDGCVSFANSDPRMVTVFLAWLRRFFAVDESRLRVRLYLHQGLDLRAATDFWSAITNVPPTQFRRPYRAAADPSRRAAKHPNGIATVHYACSPTHRLVTGLVDALLSSDPIPG